MTKTILTFLATFLAGAVIALVARAAMFNPNDDHATPAAVASADPHAAHSAIADRQSAIPARTAPVNTVCAICGMDVDPSLPTAEYKGQTIGFGCRMCPPKFKADPDKYGPAYLKNEVLDN